VLEGFRSVLLGTQSLNWLWIEEGLAVGIFLFFGGMAYFSRMEKNFADVV